MENNYKDGELEKKVLEKLEQKIAVENYKTENKIEKKKSHRGIKVASMIVASVLVFGNIYTFARYEEDMFSWALNKMGIFTKYNEEKKIVDETQEYEGIDLTLTDYGIDGDTFIVGYKLKLDEKKEFERYLSDESSIYCDGKPYVLESNNQTDIFYKISDTEYDIYKFYKINSKELEGNCEFNTEIYLFKDWEVFDVQESMIGKWNFNVKLDLKEMKLDYEEYVVQSEKGVLESEERDQGGATAELLEIRKSDLLTKLVLYLDNYTTEPGINYFVKVIDETGNVLLENNLQYLIGGVPTNIILGNLDNVSKITINVYETVSHSNEVLSKGGFEVDLSKDLKPKEKVKIEKNVKIWHDLEFEYPSKSNINEETYGYFTGDQENYYIDFNLYDYVGDREFSLKHISISCYQDIFRKEAKQLVEDRMNILNVGYYGTYTEYTVYISAEDGSIEEEVVLDYDQMVELGKNRKLILPDGRELNDKIVEFDNIMTRDMQTEKIAGKEMVSYIFDEGGNSLYKRYTFIHNGYIYEMQCPYGLQYEDMVNEFLDSIKIK